MNQFKVIYTLKNDEKEEHVHDDKFRGVVEKIKQQKNCGGVACEECPYHGPYGDCNLMKDLAACDLTSAEIIDLPEKGKMMVDKRIEYVLGLVHAELVRATENFGTFSSMHEGIAVLREEYLELEQEIFKKNPNNSDVMIEAIQVAAMATRMVLDCCLKEK